MSPRRKIRRARLRAFYPLRAAGAAADVAGAQFAGVVPCARRSRPGGCRDDERFIAELQQAFGWRLGRILKAGKRHSYPLSLLTADRHVSHRLALVGNAAQTLHPIAGQGFNLGLRDVMSLAETLAEALDSGEDAGGYALLSRYQQWRQNDQQATIGVTDGLIRLFANRYAPLVVGRNLGLMAMERLPAVRDAFAKRTLGWVER